MKEIGKIFEATRLASSDPKQEEFAKVLGITQSYLSRLEDGQKPPSLKLVRRIGEFGADQRRLVELLQKVKGYAVEDVTVAREREATYGEGFAPVVGRAACGPWMEAIADKRTPSGEKRMEALPPEHRLKDKRAFWVEAQGDSMIGSGIEEGALLLVEPKAALSNGKHALVLWKGGVTVKIWRERGDELLLMPTNPKHEPLLVPKKDFEEGEGRAFRITLVQPPRPPARPL